MAAKSLCFLSLTIVGFYQWKLIKTILFLSPSWAIEKLFRAYFRRLAFKYSPLATIIWFIENQACLPTILCLGIICLLNLCWYDCNTKHTMHFEIFELFLSLCWVVLLKIFYYSPSLQFHRWRIRSCWGRLHPDRQSNLDCWPYWWHYELCAPVWNSCAVHSSLYHLQVGY